MIEKMSIEKAREAIKDRFELSKIPDGRNILYRAIGFIEGYESRDLEVNNMRDALAKIRIKECSCFDGCGSCFDNTVNIAEEVLKGGGNEPI